jgi:hypothetical protein
VKERRGGRGSSVRSHRNVATVQDLDGAVERIRIEWNIVSPAEPELA